MDIAPTANTRPAAGWRLGRLAYAISGGLAYVCLAQLQALPHAIWGHFAAVVLAGCIWTLARARVRDAGGSAYLIVLLSLPTVALHVAAAGLLAYPGANASVLMTTGLPVRTLLPVLGMAFNAACWLWLVSLRPAGAVVQDDANLAASSDWAAAAMAEISARATPVERPRIASAVVSRPGFGRRR